MNLKIFLFGFLLWGKELFVGTVKFSPASLAEMPILTREGKTRLQSLTEKAKVPQFGQCWKNAISDLEVGCKVLSEDIQSDLALKFTDCFFQMSGHEPLKCNTKKSVCLKKLSDRAFNAYTEFYTHTQSICYFLESQVWHEETEKTINKLSFISVEVSHKLDAAGKIQEQLLEQQKESLHLQNDLVDSSKTVAKSLQSSQDKINVIMKDFQNSAEKQRQLLINVFEHLLSFKKFVIDELSWFNSTIFFIGATILSFLFTSVSRTRGARLILFIIFTINFFFERFLTSYAPTNIYFLSNFTTTAEELNSSVWFCRKICSCLSVVLLLYYAFNYYDYNYLNYKLLLEIKNQNSRILTHFSSLGNSQPNKPEINTAVPNYNLKERNRNKKTWYKGYEDNFSNFNDTYFSLQRNIDKTVINSYNGNFECVDGPIKENYNETTLGTLPATNKNPTVENNLSNVSFTSEREKTVDSRKSYDLRSKKKTVYTL